MSSLPRPYTQIFELNEAVDSVSRAVTNYYHINELSPDTFLYLNDTVYPNQVCGCLCGCLCASECVRARAGGCMHVTARDDAARDS